MADVEPEADVLEMDVGRTKRRRRSLLGSNRRLSERTPLRTKLITAVLALVIIALAAISFTSVYVLRSYLTSQHDNQLQGAFASVMQNPAKTFADADTNTLYQLRGYPDVYVGVQQPGDQFGPIQNENPLSPGGNASNQFQQAAPDVPSTSAWAKANSGKLLILGAQSGSDSWRVISSPVTIGGISGTLIVSYDLGDISAEIQRLITVDVIVSLAVIVVLAIVAVGVVQANLRPLNDIEMTAGQIAAGHLDHRVPEGDPRTEIGSLGRSLNAMLTQIERAFHAQGEAEQAAHQSEERMRRFIADAAHELRTPLTTIRGFAAHYRQRGGARRIYAGASSPGGTAEGQVLSSRTDSGSTIPPTVLPDVSVSQDGLSPEDLDHLMGRVEAEATRMGMLVEDLLTLARLDQQRPLVKGPVDLLTLAADAVQDARIVSPGRPIDLIVAPGTAFLVDGDEPRLRQVLANLVNNAITHTPAGTPVRVKIAAGTLEAPRATDAPGQADDDAGTTPGWLAHAPGAAGQPSRDNAADTQDASRRLVPAVVLDVEDDGQGMKLKFHGH